MAGKPARLLALLGIYVLVAHVLPMPDGVDAQGGREGDLVNRCGPAVHRHYQRNARVAERANGVSAESVAFVYPMWEVREHGGAEVAES